MASGTFGNFILRGYNNATKVDWENDTIKCALVTSSYTPNFDTHDFFDDVTNEVTGTGYTAGGETLTPTLTLDTTNHRLVFDCADVSWSNATITARGAVFYKSTGVSSTSPLAFYVDFGEDKIVSGVTLALAINANGVAYFPYQ